MSPSWLARAVVIVLSVAASNASNSHRRRGQCHRQSNTNSTVVAAAAAASSTAGFTTIFTSSATSSTASPSPTSSGSSSGSSSGGSTSGTQGTVNAALTPNGNKAGMSGGDAVSLMSPKLSWYYNWDANPPAIGSVVPVPMLWGDGSVDSQDSSRLSTFKAMTNTPSYVLGFEEPDCPSGSGSAGMSVDDGVALWEQLIAPLKAKGTLLGSPSMCTQAAETWLQEFSTKISTQWDFTAIHVNKNSLDGVKLDIDHYAKYGKPIWITELACVNDDNQFTPCTDQGEIDSFINAVVPYLESNPNVYAYAPSNGLGLGSVWPMSNNGALTASGQTWLNAISQFH